MTEYCRGNARAHATSSTEKLTNKTSTADAGACRRRKHTETAAASATIPPTSRGQPASQSVAETRVIADELNELCTRPTTTKATSTPLPYQQPRHGDNDKSNESAGGEEKCVSKRTFLPKEGVHVVSVFCNTRATIFVCLPGKDSRVSFVPEHPVNRHCGLARTRR